MCYYFKKENLRLKHTWNFSDYGGLDTMALKPHKSKSNIALGLVFPVDFQLGRRFYIGVIYRPTFFRFGVVKNFRYEHLISVDFSWKLRIKK
jgi:hypothetical protein